MSSVSNNHRHRLTISPLQSSRYMIISVMLLSVMGYAALECPEDDVIHFYTHTHRTENCVWNIVSSQLYDLWLSRTIALFLQIHKTEPTRQMPQSAGNGISWLLQRNLESLLLLKALCRLLFHWLSISEESPQQENGSWWSTVEKDITFNKEFEKNGY